VLNLHTHSHYSRLDGMMTVQQIVERVVELGQDAVAITDHGTVSAHAELYKEAKKAGIKPIMGLETYFCDNITIQTRDSFHLCLYAMNDDGLRDLYEMQSVASDRGFYYKPRVDMALLERFGKNLVATSACMGGIVKKGEEYVVEMARVFPGRFYLELHTNHLEGQHEYNLEIVRLAEKYRLPVLVAVDAHYQRPEDAEIHRGWTSIGKEDTYYPTDDFYLMDEDDARRRLSYLPKQHVDLGIKNQHDIAYKCNITMPFGEKNYPVYDVPDQLEHLKAICRDGWRQKVPKGDDRYKERVLHEFDILAKADYINYFCIAHDLVDWCRQNRIRVGVGRGSVASSLVAYLAGITGIDPVRYDLIFERFCHLERVTNPDVDIDVSYLRRQDVISYLQQRYGTAYQVRTFSRLGERGAVQRAGQILKYQPEMIDKISTNMTNISDIQDEKLRRYTEKLVGLIDKFSIHASAIVLMPDEPYRFFAVEKQGDTLVACFYHEDIADMGVLKQDILGLRTLDILDEAEKVIKDVYGTTIDLYNLPDQDKLAFDALKQGNTSGLFQLESYGMTQLCKKINASEIDDIVHLVALFRPGPRDCGMVDTFIDNKRKGSIKFDHPLLEPILRRTHGIVLYQEQIMQICQVMCGYSLGEGDVLRRIIGKKKLSEMGPAIEKLIAAGVSNGHNQELMRHIADQIVTFANYGFNIAHAAAYGYTAYQTAYVKAHFPLAFWCGRLNAYLGDREDIVSYVAECKGQGIEVLLPDIMKSERGWKVEGESLLAGYACVKNLGENTKINHRTTDIVEFIKNNQHMNKRVVESMILAGMFPGNRGELLYLNEEYRKFLSAQHNCVAMMSEYQQQGKPDRVKFWQDKMQKLIQPKYTGDGAFNNAEGESSVLGFSNEDILGQYVTTGCNGANTLCGEVVSFNSRLDKKKNKMAFVTLRTKQGVRELVMFHRKYREMVVGKVYIVEIENTQIVDLMEARKSA
jgi:DNA polymerase III subunit alpha